MLLQELQHVFVTGEIAPAPGVVGVVHHHHRARRREFPGEVRRERRVAGAADHVSASHDEQRRLGLCSALCSALLITFPVIERMNRMHSNRRGNQHALGVKGVAYAHEPGGEEFSPD